MIVKWIIFYCSLMGVNEYPMGDIIFLEDSVRIFESNWKIISQTDIVSDKDKLYRGTFVLEKDNNKAHLLIIERDITFVIEGIDITVTAKQMPHYEYLYEDIEELGYVIKKKLLAKRKNK